MAKSLVVLIAVLAFACTDTPTPMQPTPSPTPGPDVTWHWVLNSDSTNPVRFSVAMRFDGQEVYRSTELTEGHGVTLVRPYEPRVYRMEFTILSATRSPALYQAAWSVRGGPTPGNANVSVLGAPRWLSAGETMVLDWNLAGSL